MEGLRERKRRRTRALLEEAALALFEERGYAETSVEDIARAADVSPRSFYRYFGSKEEIVFALADVALGDLRRRIAARPTDESPWEAVRRASYGYALEAERRKDEGLRRMRLIPSSPTLRKREAQEVERWASALLEEVAARRPADGAFAHLLVAEMAMAAIRTAYVTWVAAGGTESYAELVERAFLLAEEAVGGRASTSGGGREGDGPPSPASVALR